MVAIAPRLHGLIGPPAESQSWSLWSLALTRSVDQALADEAFLDEVTRALADVVGPLEADAIGAASDTGARIATELGCVLGVGVWTQGQEVTGRVVVVDAVVNTGVLVSRAADDARADGALEVIAVCVVAQREAAESLGRGQLSLMALETV